jgi:hypothetical protein
MDKVELVRGEATGKAVGFRPAEEGLTLEQVEETFGKVARKRANECLETGEYRSIKVYTPREVTKPVDSYATEG